MKTKYDRPKDLEKIIEQVIKLSEARGDVPIPGLSSPYSERLKFNLCQQILKFKMRREMTNAQMAELLNTNQARISEMCRCRYDLYTVDRLIDYVQILASHDKDLKAKIEKGILAL